MLIDKKPNKVLSFLLITWEKGILIALTLGLVGQCTSNQDLRNRVQSLSDRDVIVQVGSDREVTIGKKLTEVENREQFIAETFKSMSWVKRTSAEFQEQCKEIAKEKKNVSLFNTCKLGIDPGVQTPKGRFSSQFYSYQHLIAPESMDAIIGWVLALKPKGYDSPQNNTSRALQVTGIGQHEKFSENGSKETRTAVELQFSEGNGPTVVRSFKKYYWIYTRPIVGPTKNGARTPFSDAADATQRRGLLLTRIIPYTNTPF